MLYCLIRKVATLDDPQAWSSCEMLDSDFVDHRPALLITPKSSSRAWYNRSQSMAFEIFGTKVSDDIHTNIPHYSTTSPLSMPLYAHSIRIISIFSDGFLHPLPKTRRSTGQVSCRPCSSGAPRNHRPRYLRGSSGPCRRTFQVPGDRWKYHPNFPKKKRCLSGESPRIVIQCALTSWKTGHTHGKKGNVLLGNMFWGSFGTMQPSASLNQPTNQPTNHPTTQPPRHFGKDLGNRMVLPSEKVEIPLPSLTHYLNLFDKVGTCLRNLFLLSLSLVLSRSPSIKNQD